MGNLFEGDIPYVNWPEAISAPIATEHRSPDRDYIGGESPFPLFQNEKYVKE